MHTLHPCLVTHADTFPAYIPCHSLLAFGVSVTQKCSPSLSTLPAAMQYSPTSAYFPLISILMSRRTPNIRTTSIVPFQSFFRHPPYLTVSFFISSENISSFFVFGKCSSYWDFPILLVEVWRLPVLLPAHHTKQCLGS